MKLIKKTLIIRRFNYLAKPWFGLVLATTLLICSGCIVVGPDYRRPCVSNQVPASFDVPHGWKTAEPGDGSDLSRWWAKFGDPQLNRLVEEATGCNFDIVAAFHRIEQARAISDRSRSALFPILEFEPSVSRQRRSGTISNAANNVTGRTTTNLSLPLVMEYEIDLWGRIRRELEAACAETLASEAAHRQVRLLVQTEVASRYIELRATDAEIELFLRESDLRERALELNRKRFEAGDTNEVDVSRAETELYATRTELIQLRQFREEVENAIALLVGKPSSGFSIPSRSLYGSPPQIPASVPCQLLERRPDVAEAERVMMAENARIGVAKAAFFPTISIDGTFGLESGSTAALFNPASRTWLAGADAVAPIFYAGRNRAELKRSEARYCESVAAYRQAILTAVREVDDALVANRRLEEQARAQRQTVAAARRTVELTRKRYRAGVDTYFEVVDAERTALEAEQAAVRIRAAQFTAVITLVRALGGDWNHCVAQVKPAEGHDGADES